MYTKKDIIYSSTMGLVLVKDVTRLSPDRSAPVLYYVLRSFYDKEKTAYIPVENHEVELRDLISKEDAEKLKTTILERINNKELDVKEYLSEDEDILNAITDVDPMLGEVSYVLEMSPAELVKALVVKKVEE